MEQKIDLSKKEFMFRGKTMEELKQINIREFAKLLKSNKRRSVLRQSEELEKFVSRCNKKMLNKKPIRTHFRHLIIVPKMIGLRIHIHNGKDFVPINIIEEMLGHRLGEFSVTRSKVKHGAAGIGATRSSAALSVK